MFESGWSGIDTQGMSGLNNVGDSTEPCNTILLHLLVVDALLLNQM